MSGCRRGVPIEEGKLDSGRTDYYWGIFSYIKYLAYERAEEFIYIGSSAGASIAGSDIMLMKDFDSNFVGLYDYRSLELFEGALVPHFTREQLHSYISCIEPHVLERYPGIYYVENEGARILEI